MIMQTLVVGALQVNCYILGCERTRLAVVVDPGDNARSIRAALDKQNLKLACILATHAHFDHVMAARALQEATGAPFYLHPADRPVLAAMRATSMNWMGRDPGELPTVDGELPPGEPIRFGDEVLEVRGTPGHSPGGVTFVDQPGRRAPSPAIHCSPARSGAPTCPEATLRHCWRASERRS